MNCDEVLTIKIDSVEISEAKLKRYILNKIIENKVSVCRVGYRYINDIMFLMMRDIDSDRNMRSFMTEVGKGKIPAQRIDKAVGSAIDVSLAEGGFEKLDEFMCGAISRKHTSASVLYAFREYLRYCLYEDATAGRLTEI